MVPSLHVVSSAAEQGDVESADVLAFADGLQLELHVEQQATILHLVAQLAVLATKAPECLTDHNSTNTAGPILEVGPVIRACATCSWNTASDCHNEIRD